MIRVWKVSRAFIRRRFSCSPWRTEKGPTNLKIRVIWLTLTALIFKNIFSSIRRNQASMEGLCLVRKQSSNIFSTKSKQQFKRGLCCSVENLEKGEVRKLIKNTKLLRIVRTSISYEKLWRNLIQLSKKIPQKLYSRTDKYSEEGRREDQR